MKKFKLTLKENKPDKGDKGEKSADKSVLDATADNTLSKLAL